MRLFNLLKVIIYIITICLLFVNVIKTDQMMVMVCLLAIFFYFLIAFFEYIFKLKMSSLLKFILYLFIFGGLVLGEVCKFYSFLSFFDNFLHFIGGFLGACLGLSLVYKLLIKSKIKKTIVTGLIFVICFSITLGVLWEFLEYSADRILDKNMQKDVIVNNFKSNFFDKDDILQTVEINNILKTRIYTIDNIITVEGGYIDIGLSDTIEDLFFDFIGASLLSAFVYLYYLGNNKFIFVNYLVLRK